MYTPPAFKVDRSASLEFASAHGFGVVCAFDGNKPIASPLPFDIDYGSDGTPCVSFHVARGNPLAACADGQASWLVTVNGPHAYVSPHWYASADQVPTWLYQTVHLTGPARIMSEAELVQNLDRLSAKFEAGLAPKPAWTVGEVSAGRREMLLRMITGIVMTVETVEGSFKLNQTKSEADAISVAAALAGQRNQDAQTIAKQMIALRSQLDYKSPISVSLPADPGNAS
jgi:transcriptional regulator